MDNFGTPDLFENLQTKLVALSSQKPLEVSQVYITVLKHIEDLRARGAKGNPFATFHDVKTAVNEEEVERQA